METQQRVYTVNRKIVGANGEVRYRQEKCKYNLKREPKPEFAQEEYEKIKELHNIGVTKKKLCEKYNISYYMLGQILAKN